MTDSFRSGNSRTLAKTLDQLGHPLAVLDRRGVIVFVNLPLCQLFKADATQLVGQSCSWQVAEDDSPFGALLTALAPPAGALQGKLVVRRLTTPIVFDSTQSGQLFIPLLDDEGTPQATLVALGEWSGLSAQLHAAEPPSVQRKQVHGSLLTAIRSRWQNLDDLHSLIGTSAAIELAMARAQLAISQPCGLLVSGPAGVEKSDIVRGVFLGRLKRAGLPKMAGQLFPIDCRIAEDEQLEEMLDRFAGRLRPELPPQSQLLLIERIEQLSDASVERLNRWLESTSGQCSAAATSVSRADELASRGLAWGRLLSRLATVEVAIPPLSQRRQDIAPVAMQLLAVACENNQRAQLSFTPEALQLINAFPWPENHRQLSEAIDEAVGRAVLVANIQVVHLPVAVRSYSSTNEQLEAGPIEPIDLDQVLLQCERIMLSRALKLSPRNRAQAARLLGISRPRLLRRIEQLGLDPKPQ
ncbi:MAG: hypothetical protein KDA51_16130 [Planctomycetales bacterium]|nr:hypothetical protein [Planctomycetales bacterium]